MSYNGEAKHILRFVYRDWMNECRRALSQWFQWLCVLLRMILLFYGSVDGFQRNLLCHICSASSHLCFFPLEAALLSGFASSFSSIALMYLVRLGVSEIHFWIIEPSRVCFFCNSTSTFFPPQLSPHLSVFPISFLVQTLTFNFLCVLLIPANAFMWEEGRRPYVTQAVIMLPQFMLVSVEAYAASGIHVTAVHSYQQLHLAFRIQLWKVEAHQSHNLWMVSPVCVRAQKWRNKPAGVTYLSQQLNVPSSDWFRNCNFQGLASSLAFKPCWIILMVQDSQKNYLMCFCLWFHCNSAS